jgi:hypothetical protein
MRVHKLLTILIAATGVVTAFADDTKPVIREGDSKRPLKERHQFNGTGSVSYEGVVTAIDENTLTLDGNGGVKWIKGTYKLHALDLHKAGEVQDWASGPCSYRWQDVKKGDTINVSVMKDQADGVFTPYVYEICIARRPGGELPKSQKPKEDTSWRYRSFLNDIDNGEDKTDEEITKMFPPHINGRTGMIDDPGGLPNEYKVKLTALREKLAAEKAKKQDKDLKAGPPAEDKKK